jgi:patatin-like phospholipase/acyl hydrolase
VDSRFLSASYAPLDGGGVRGLSELLILRQIMERIQFQQKLKEIPLPCDYFDLIGGTSTGGLVIIAVSSLPAYLHLSAF